MSLATDAAEFIGGFVAAEGMFNVCPNGNHQSFTFAVQLGASDREVCSWLRDFFGVGWVRQYPRRKPHYDDEVRFVVRKLQDLVEVIIPFMDDHLPESYKRRQYVKWRATLLEYWRHQSRRRARCSEPGCELPAKAMGLCRGHYYQRYRR